MSRRDQREKELRLALKRIETGRITRIQAGRKLSILAVAQEAGIDATTIHTRYPAIAELIRSKTGKAARERNKAKDDIARELRRRLTAAKLRIKELQQALAELASVHHCTLLELQKSRAIASNEGKVVGLERKADTTTAN